MGQNKSLLRELWDYLKIKKNYWLLPIIIIILLASLLIVLGQSSVLSPFIYTIF